LKVYLRVAWRNILANKRRTILSTLIIMVGMALTVFMWAIENGAQDIMINHMTDLFTSQVQVERAGFSDDYDVKKVITDTTRVFSQIKSAPGVVAFAPRVMATGMARSTRTSTGAILVGIDPEAESRVSKLPDCVSAGEFLKPGDARGAVIGDRMAGNLGLEMGDKIVIMAMDSTGNIAGEALRIRGFLHLGATELDRSLVLVNSGTLRKMLLVNGYQIIAVKVKNARGAPGVAARINPGDGILVRPWQEFMPELLQGMQMDEGSIFIILLLFLLLAVAGIANTMLMSVKQRVREFGIMQAVGMKPGGVFFMVVAEGALLSVAGIAAGLVLGVIVTAIVGIFGIDISAYSSVLETYGAGLLTKFYPRIGYLFWAHFHEPIIGFLVTGVLSSLYPAYVAAKKHPSEAIRYY
jgi:putative ABC transport system permease protein